MPSLKQTVKTIDFARNYFRHITLCYHSTLDGNKISFYTNNLQIAPYLSQDFDLITFKKLFNLCQNNGVFDLHFSNHIPCVTFNAAAKHMTRKWPRDHMGMIPLIAECYPDELWHGLLQWCNAYSAPEEIKGFERVFKKPACARHNHGIAHVFWQNSDGSLRRDVNWKMNQRIESHGEFLRCLTSETITRIKKNLPVPSQVIQTIVRLTHYLYIQGISPQSCGPWEEIPFANGCNWDNLSVVQAFKQVINLQNELILHSLQQKKFQSFDNRLSNSFKLTPLFSDISHLDDFIIQSSSAIRHFYLQEFRGATSRVDSSLTMLAAEDFDFSVNGDLLINIRKHLKVLAKFEKHLLHKFGAWRYNSFKTTVDGQEIISCDSYLNLNYYLLCDKDGFLYQQKNNLACRFDNNINTPNDNGVSNFTQRALAAKEKTSAQWGLPLSYTAIAYGKLVALLLNKRDKSGKLSSAEQQLLNFCFNKEQEFIKRTYATISGCCKDGTPFLKADGQPIAAFRKPEAYQAVTSCIGGKDFAYIPGVNDHLGWDAAKCFEASQLFLSNLRRFELFS